VERNRKADQNPPRVVAPSEEEEEGEEEEESCAWVYMALNNAHTISHIG